MQAFSLQFLLFLSSSSRCMHSCGSHKLTLYGHVYMCGEHTLPLCFLVRVLQRSKPYCIYIYYFGRRRRIERNSFSSLIVAHSVRSISEIVCDQTTNVHLIDAKMLGKIKSLALIRHNAFFSVLSFAYFLIRCEYSQCSSVLFALYRSTYT